MGFQHRVVQVNGDDCGLATRKQRSFIVMMRAASSASDVADVDAALARMREMSLCERGQAGFSTVRDAIGTSIEKQYYCLPPRQKGGAVIHDLDKPAPVIRSTAFEFGSELSSAYTPCHKDATTDISVSGQFKYLTWRELMRVHSFKDSFKWSEPTREQQSVRANLSMLIS